MNGKATIEEPVSSTKMLQAMVGIGTICALLIVLTYEGTKPRIEENKKEALQKAIFNVIPEVSQTKTFQLNPDGTFTPSETNGSKDLQFIYAGYTAQGNLVGIAIEASGQGYADIIRILYGYDPTTEMVVGFYVLESKETPGLGDKIEKDADFLSNFKNLDVSLTEDQSRIKNTVIPVKRGTKTNLWEVDGITGATISSRAIGNIIGTSSTYWMPIIQGNIDTFKNSTE